MRNIVISVILTISVLINQDTTGQENKLNQFSDEKEWIFSSDEYDGVEIHNRHGDIIISPSRGDTLAINVIISVESDSRESADEVLKKIEINNSKNEGRAYFRTSFSEDFYSNYAFKITYEVLVPVKNTLKLNNQFGDIRLASPTTSLDITLKYGNLSHESAVPIDTVRGSLSFVKAGLNKTKVCELDLNNTDIEIQEVDKGTFTGQYYQLDIADADLAEFKGKTTRLNISKINEINIDGDFCFASIEKIQEAGQIEITNGMLIIGGVSNRLKELSIANSNAPVNLTLPESLTYNLHGEVTNGQFIHYNRKMFRIVDDHEKTSFSGSNSDDKESASIVLFNENAGINIKNKK
ncbi:MAG: hypothetical protein PWR04_825 [Anaerophaga sp.]|nr:hypothetical protein [Anaerophaga sp.]